MGDTSEGKSRFNKIHIDEQHEPQKNKQAELRFFGRVSSSRLFVRHVSC